MMSFESKNFNLLYNNVLILIRISLFSASLVFILHFSLNWLERASIGGTLELHPWLVYDAARNVRVCDC